MDTQQALREHRIAHEAYCGCPLVQLEYYRAVGQGKLLATAVCPFRVTKSQLIVSGLGGKVSQAPGNGTTITMGREYRFNRATGRRIPHVTGSQWRLAKGELERINQENSEIL